MGAVGGNTMAGAAVSYGGSVGYGGYGGFGHWNWIIVLVLFILLAIVGCSIGFFGGAC